MSKKRVTKSDVKTFRCEGVLKAKSPNNLHETQAFLCKVLGLDGSLVTGLSLHFSHDALPRVCVDMVAMPEDVGKIAGVLDKCFEVVEKEEDPDS